VPVGGRPVFVLTVGKAPDPRRFERRGVGQHDVPDNLVVSQDVVVIAAKIRRTFQEKGHGGLRQPSYAILALC
jgi:hypothetical protein